MGVADSLCCVTLCFCCTEVYVRASMCMCVNVHIYMMCVHARLAAQSCLTLCDPHGL